MMRRVTLYLATLLRITTSRICLETLVGHLVLGRLLLMKDIEQKKKLMLTLMLSAMRYILVLPIKR